MITGIDCERAIVAGNGFLIPTQVNQAIPPRVPRALESSIAREGLIEQGDGFLKSPFTVEAQAPMAQRIGITLCDF
jgi:hypothetical protein